MDIVGTSLPENQHAMVRWLVVGLARWESRLISKHNATASEIKRPNHHVAKMDNAEQHIENAEVWGSTLLKHNFENA